MKSSFDLKHDLGRITPETPDDLWVLSEIIRPGDFVKSKTLRSVEVKRTEGKEKVGKRAVILTIHVEKVILDTTLRLGGKILEGPGDMSRGYHTIDIKEGTYLEINREWKSWEINKIKASAIKQEPVTVLILDDSEADFYLIREKTEHIAHIRSSGLGKSMGVSGKPEYYRKLLSQLEKTETKIIIVGPGFAKEELIKILKERNKELASKIIVDSVSHTGEVGLQEVFKRGLMDKILKSSRISDETDLVEKFLTEIVKEGLAVYGINETREAVEKGAVQTLLVSDKKVREVDDIMENAEKMSTKVRIISSAHQSGEKLFRMGGIGGILRYKM